jgi:D-alanyl-D-alanine carboxypeptidase (penicillin-binding protein 5/6)
MEKFAHPQGRFTEITNTNKLIRFYDGCDGGKTGFTNEAGFCLAATAIRKDMRIISVVIGEESSANRFEDVKTMFDYAFSNYSVSPIIQANIPIEETVKVNGGKKDEVNVYPERTVYAFVKRGEALNITVEKSLKKLKTPIIKGSKIGELIVFKDGVEIDRVALLASETVKTASVMDRMKKIAQKWNG